MSHLKNIGIHRKLRSYREWMVLLLIAVVGCAISFAVYSVQTSAEESLNRINFEMAGDRRLFLLRERVSDLETVFGSLQDYYSVSGEVSRKEFGLYVKRLLERHPGLKALEWVPRVTDDSLSKFIEQARRDGFPDFGIKEKDSQSLFVKRPQQSEYFPVYYLEPFHGNETVLGFDLASESTGRKALEMSRDTGQMIATEQVRLAQESEHPFGFLVFVPVYFNGASVDTVDERRKNLRGFVLGVFGTRDLFLMYFKNSRRKKLKFVFMIEMPGAQKS